MDSSTGNIVAAQYSTGQVIQEFGYDDDVDFDLRDTVEAAIGEELADEDYADVSDGAITWWRDSDGELEDLTDLLVDVQSNLDDGGIIWVLTPKAGDDEHVAPADVEEAAQTAGMFVTSAVSAAPLWSGFRVVSRARGR